MEPPGRSSRFPHGTLSPASGTRWASIVPLPPPTFFLEFPSPLLSPLDSSP
ncbi:IQ motif and Sec7 domain ArfGEF 2 [Homo sapiens]|uniref:IQ motif and Sec7 domain ArfGEF 2 n=1 Tax=Homo sapiens TaxID=9606 RepID=A0A6Q8PG99_HUMAN|nr:IQ motif and Sec7 domain ArfGEF 2 [Homo sapiens]KAI3999794.1 IQ motif and Sec7 domain ArfGEF 2 [Homo sapiens]